MNIKDNIGKITWSFLDKGTYLVFGFFILYQLKYLGLNDLAYFESMNIFNNWVFLLADGLALNGLIQFGSKKENKAQVNFYSLVTIIVFSLTVSLIIFSLRDLVSSIFNDSSFSKALFYLPLIALFTISRNFTLKYLYRELRFMSIFFLNLSFFTAQIIATLYFIYETGSLDFLKMIYILFIGSITATLLSLFVIAKDLKFSKSGNLEYKKFLKFGIVVTKQQVFHSIPKSFDFYIITVFFGASLAGLYSAAKKLFKTFDEAASAAHGLIYPSAVKTLAENNIGSFKAIMTKSLSALLIVFLLLIVALNLGLTDYLLNLYGHNTYLAAADIFNFLVISGIFIPFALLAPLMNASGNEKRALIYKQIAFIAWLIVILSVSYLNYFSLTPLAMIVYYGILGFLCFRFMQKEYNFRSKDILRFITDIKSALNNR